MKVAVSGAAGFIGSHLVPALEKGGWDVLPLVEPGQGAEAGGFSVLHADIVSGQGLDEAFEGVGSVIHLAARNHVLRETAENPLKEYRRVNVEGTRNVIRMARKQGVELFIHLSSVKAMGEESSKPIGENAPCLPSTPYGISKRESEDVVLDETRVAGMSSVILRLPMVYGPGNKGNLPRMIRWADRGLPFPVFQPDNLRSMVYVENVVAGILTILKDPPPDTTTYIMKDREDYSTQKVYSAICRALGKSPIYLKIPAPIVKLAGKISHDFRKVSGSFLVSSEKIEREIGFIPPFSLEDGIARTVHWYKNPA